MRTLDAEAFAAALPMEAAIDAMAAVFGAAGRGELEVPPRTVLRQPIGAGRESLLLTMSASWRGRVFATKVSSYIADNPAHGHPAVQGVASLIDANSGRPLLVADAAALTVRRTAAMVGLATRELARSDAAVLGLIGTGALAADMVRAVRAVRPIVQVRAFNRTPEAARRLIASLDIDGVVVAEPELAAQADILVVATPATEPVLDGNAVGAGTHVNAVGNFSATGREIDGELVGRCRCYVDSYEGAAAEAGDLLLAAAEGHIAPGRDGLVGELAELAAGRCPGRRDDDEITLFKSVGTAIADLAGLWAAAGGASRRSS